jgi:hypothetical protein
MAKFRKKPVVIDAITWDELVEHGKKEVANNQMPGGFRYGIHHILCENDECYVIHTLEGMHHMTPKDMLITGIQGEIYPCKIDVFEQTYEPVE